MPRAPRLDFPGALHHLMARGIERRDIFLDDGDRIRFLQRLSTVAGATNCEVFAWALMKNHFHLLARTGDTPIGRVMQGLLAPYATSFNRRNARSGHLFQNRFKSILVEEQPYLLELVRYIHLNPLRAGIVTTLEDLDDYPWTGHPVLLGKTEHLWQRSDHVLSLFGTARGQARREYRDFLAAGIKQGRRPELANGTLIRRLGQRVLKALRRGRESWACDERVLGSEEFVLRILQQQGAPQRSVTFTDEDLAELLATVAARLGLPAAAIRGNGLRRDLVRARAIVSFLAVRQHGLALARVARALNTSPQSVVRGIKAAPAVLEELRCTAGSFAA